ncbi:hypothetical protein OSTOST_07572 [Ostertagia ostertagi]
MWIETILQKLPRQIIEEFLRENKSAETCTVGETLDQLEASRKKRACSTHRKRLSDPSAISVTELTTDLMSAAPSKKHANAEKLPWKRHVSKLPLLHVYQQPAKATVQRNISEPTNFTPSQAHPLNVSSAAFRKQHIPAQSGTISAGEQVVLMTAEGLVWNYFSEQYHRALFLFDTGAQLSLIFRELHPASGSTRAKKTEQCSLSGIKINVRHEDSGIFFTEEEIDDENANSYLSRYAKLLQYDGETVSAPFPLKSKTCRISDNYNMAFRRLVAQMKHLAQFPEKRAWYVKTIEHMLNMVLTAYLQKCDTPLANEILSLLYVDNVLLGAYSKEEAVEKYKESKALFSAIGMNLRAFVSNCTEVNDQIKKEDKAPYEQMKLLGVDYDPITDTYSLKTGFSSQPKVKRDYVKQHHSIYDPIGLGAPLMIRQKHMLRSMFQKNLEWDSVVDPEFALEWQKTTQAISNFHVQIPRQMDPRSMDSDFFYIYKYLQGQSVSGFENDLTLTIEAIHRQMRNGPRVRKKKRKS